MRFSSKGIIASTVLATATFGYSVTAMAAAPLLFVGGQLGSSDYKGAQSTDVSGNLTGNLGKGSFSGSDASYGGFLEFGNKYQKWRGWLDILNSSDTPIADLRIDYAHDSDADVYGARLQTGYRYGISQYSQFDILLNSDFHYFDGMDSDTYAKSAYSARAGLGLGYNQMIDRYNVVRLEAGANYGFYGRIKQSEGPKAKVDHKVDPYAELTWINQKSRFAFMTSLFYDRQTLDMDGSQQQALAENLNVEHTANMRRNVVGVRFGIGF